MIAPIPTSSVTVAIGAASAQLGAMVAGCYLLSVTSAAWVTQGANPTATAGAGSMLVQPTDGPVMIDGALGAKLALLQVAAGGTATLTKCRQARPL